MAVTGAIAAVATAGTAIYGATQAGGISSQAQGESSSVFGEQQYYAQQLQQLMANPQSVSSLPGYQFNFNQGAQAVQRQEGAAGFNGSGNEGIALTQYGQNFATSAYTTQEQMLSQLAGLTAPSSPSQLTSAAAGSQNQSFNQLGTALTALGYGAGKVGTSGVFSNPASSPELGYGFQSGQGLNLGTAPGYDAAISGFTS